MRNRSRDEFRGNPEGGTVVVRGVCSIKEVRGLIKLKNG